MKNFILLFMILILLPSCSKAGNTGDVKSIEENDPTTEYKFDTEETLSSTADEIPDFESPVEMPIEAPDEMIEPVIF